MSAYSGDVDDIILQVSHASALLFAERCDLRYTQRVPDLDVLSLAAENNKMGSTENTAVHDYPTLDINISIGLSSFAEADIMAARVRAAASRRKGLRASSDP